jgi:hypothetical protein
MPGPRVAQDIYTWKFQDSESETKADPGAPNGGFKPPSALDALRGAWVTAVSAGASHRCAVSARCAGAPARF